MINGEHLLQQLETETTKGQADVSFQIPANPDMYSKIVAAVKLADNIRTYGHLAADINPLKDKDRRNQKNRTSREYNLTEEDLKQVPASFISPNAPSNLKDGLDAINHLKKSIYAKTWLLSIIKSMN